MIEFVDLYEVPKALRVAEATYDRLREEFDEIGEELSNLKKTHKLSDRTSFEDAVLRARTSILVQVLEKMSETFE